VGLGECGAAFFCSERALSREQWLSLAPADRAMAGNGDSSHDDNGDGAFGPSPGDLARIEKMYPSIATDIIPVEKRR
jgi:hypothetical protein